MNKLIALVTLVATLFVVGIAQSNGALITLDQNTLLYSGANGGGEFKATTDTLGTFQTFCLEDNEYFSPGSTYTFQINSGAVRGGVSGQDAISGASMSVGQPMDNISIGTAWLYNMFRQGQPIGYNYTPGIPRTQTATALQDTIWWLEGELANKPADSLPYLLEARLALNLPDDNALKTDSNGAYGVVALNLFDRNGGYVQDQLAVVPEPSTMIAGFLLLMPFAASTLRILKRRQLA